MHQLGGSLTSDQGEAAGGGGRHLPYQPALDGIRGSGRSRRSRLPRRPSLGSRRLPRRRRLLRPQRLPHHQPAPRGVACPRRHRPLRVLGATGPPAPAGAVPHAHRRRRLCRRLRRARGAREAPRRRPRHDRLRGQLAAHIHRPVLLRPVLRPLSSPPHLVAGDRGAVVRGLAAAAPGPSAPAPRLAAARCSRCRWSCSRPPPSLWAGCTNPAPTPPASTTAPTRGRSPC